MTTIAIQREQSRIRSARWRKADPERARANGRRFYQNHLEQERQKGRDRYHVVRRAVLDAYGGICQCCGEAEEKFLAIDHINGRGNDHRKLVGRNLYYELKKTNYPEGYQTLCHNCNAAKGFYGQCPHSMP